MATTPEELKKRNKKKASISIAADYKLAWQLQAEKYKKAFQQAENSNLYKNKSQTLYHFQLENGSDTSFVLKETGDRDCFFHAVNRGDFNRDSLVKRLLQYATDETVREHFAHEIRQFLYLGHTGFHSDPKENLACQALLSDEIKQLFTTLQATEVAITPKVIEARSAVGELKTQGKNHAELLDLLQQENHKLATEFARLLQAIKDANEAIYQYCLRIDVFKDYVNAYLDKACGYIPFSRDLGKELPTTTIDVFNQLFDLNIRVYLSNSSNKNQLEAVTRIPKGAEVPIYHNGINHFWRLVPNVKKKAEFESESHPKKNESIDDDNQTNLKAVNKPSVVSEIKSVSLDEAIRGLEKGKSIVSVSLYEKLRRRILEQLAYLEEEDKKLTGGVYGDYVEIKANYPKNIDAKISKTRDDFSLLPEIVTNFIGKKEAEILLLLGEAGSGKSWAGRKLVETFWKSNLGQEKIILPYIPLWIPLVSIKDPTQDLLKGHLHYNLNLTETEIQEIVESRPPLLLILDGYDEIDGNFNLYESNKFKKYRDIKLIITCRTEYLPNIPKPYQYKFSIGSKGPVEYQLAKFSVKQIEEYVKSYVRNLEKAEDSKKENTWNDSRYLQEIYKIPNLEELISNPFILTIVIASLQEIVSSLSVSLPNSEGHSSQGLQRIKLTRENVYKIFTDKYFHRQANKVLESANNSQKTREIIDVLISSLHDKMGSFQSSQLPSKAELLVNYFAQSTRNLAYCLYQRRRNYVNYPEKTSKFMSASLLPAVVEDERDEWAAFFFDKNENPYTSILLSACLLKNNNGRYTFWHDSLRDFFAAQDLFQGVLVDAWVMSGQNLNSRPLWKDRPLEFNFLVDMASQNEEFKNSLINIVMNSKHEPHIWKAAANAITILHFSGVMLHRELKKENLQRIRVGGKDEDSLEEGWGASLPGAVLDGLDVSESDLRYVDLTQAHLCNTNLSGSCMDGIKLTELPSMPGDLFCLSKFHPIIAIAHNVEGENFIGKDKTNYSLSIYNVNDYQIVTKASGDGEIIALDFDDAGSELAFSIWLNQKASIKIWSFKEKTSPKSFLKDNNHEQIRYLAYTDQNQLIYYGGDGITIIDRKSKRKIFNVGIFDSSLPCYFSNSRVLVIPREDVYHIISKKHSEWTETILKPHNDFRGFTEKVVADSKHELMGIIFQGNSVKIYHFKDNKWFNLSKTNGKATALAFQNDNSILYVGTKDGNIQLWDISNLFEQKLIVIIPSSAPNIESLHLVSDSILVYTSSNKTVYYLALELMEKKTIAEKYKDGHSEEVTAVALSSDDGNLFSISTDNTMRKWDAVQGKLTRSFLAGIIFDWWKSMVCWEEGPFIISTDINRLRIWSAKVTVGSDISVKPENFFHSYFSQKVYDASLVKGEEQEYVEVETHHNVVFYLRDRKELILASNFQSLPILVVSLNSPNCLNLITNEFYSQKKYVFKTVKEIPNSRATTRSLSYCEKTNKLAVGNGGITIWDMSNLSSKPVLLQDLGMILALDYRPDGVQLAAAALGEKNDLLLFNFLSGSVKKRTISTHPGEITTLKYSDDSKYLASGSKDRQICLWDADTTTCLISYHSGTVPSCLAWMKHDRNLVTGGKDGSLRLWQFTIRINQKHEKEVDVTLLWQTRGYLSTQNLNLTNVYGLAASHYELFKQRSMVQGRSTLTGHAPDFSRRSIDVIKGRNDHVPERESHVYPLVSGDKKNEFVISDELWLVSVVRKKPNISRPGSDKHVFILIQGMEGKGRSFYRVIKELHFFLEKGTQLFFGSFGKAFIDIRDKSFWNLQEMVNQDAYLAVNYSVEATKAQQLINNVKLEREKTKLYSYPGSKFLPGDNCLSWCNEQIKKIELPVKNDWLSVFCANPERMIPNRNANNMKT